MRRTILLIGVFGISSGCAQDQWRDLVFGAFGNQHSSAHSREDRREEYDRQWSESDRAEPGSYSDRR